MATDLPNGSDFETVSEVDCCIACAPSNDEGEALTLTGQVRELTKLRKERDDLNRRWRQTLLKIWELARQTKTGLNDDARGLAQTASTLLTEIRTKTQQCNKIFYTLQNCPEEIKLCDLATCFWCPKKEVQLGCSVFSCDHEIECCGRSEMKTFRDATVGYLENNFQHLEQAHRVPSVLLMSDEYKQGTKRRLDRGVKSGGKIGRLSYYSDRHLAFHNHLTGDAIQHITSDRKGARAVELLVEKLVSCEAELPGGMFVISNLKHQNYLCKMKTKQQLITAQDGDHDIIVIHRRLGVIFFQVKGCSTESEMKTKRTAVLKAVEQVIMDKFVFLESNRDLEFVHNILPVHGFAALPHLYSSDLNELNICPKHRRNVLTFDDLGNLSDWLKERVAPHGVCETEVLNEDQYKILCGRYVGLVSAVSLRTYDEGIRKVGQMVETIFLTPAQVALVEETHHKFLFITGDYGTGKSLVLAKKAQKLVEEDEDCFAFLISCSDVDFYQLCKFEKPYQSADQLHRLVNNESYERIWVLQFSDILWEKFAPDEDGKKMVSYGEFYDIIVSYVSDFAERHKGVKTHIFLDEVVVILFLTGLREVTERCEVWDNIESALPEGSFCWISISTHSFIMTRELHPDRLVPFMPVGFEWYYLEFVMRVTICVCKLIKAIEDHIGKGFFHYSSIGHTFMGPMPLLGTLAGCECPKPTTPLCLCGQTRLLKVLKKVKEKFNFENHKVTIVIFLFHCEGYLLPLYCTLQSMVQSAFSELGIGLEWNTMYGLQVPWVEGDPSKLKKKVSVVDQNTFTGCESQNIMCIDMFGMFQWFSTVTEWSSFIVNRCTSQYVHISWPEKEARKQWLCFLDGYEEYCKASLDADKMKFVTKMLNTARSSQGQCVHRLKEKHVIQEVV